MLLQNQIDLEKTQTPAEISVLYQTHKHLKDMEIALTRKMGTVILK